MRRLIFLAVLVAIVSCKKEQSTLSLTDYDGNVYKVVEIGNQIWMAENLNVSHYSNGTPIPYVADKKTWESFGVIETRKAYCWYDNNPTNGSIYGALYTWDAAMNISESGSQYPDRIQGVCPAGWHVASDEEWKELEIYLGMSQTEADRTAYRGTREGGLLKEEGTLHWASPNLGATNSSGFTALPGGLRYDDGTFEYLTYSGTWWTYAVGDTLEPWDRDLYYDTANVGRYDNGYVNWGCSVRCVKN